MKKSYTEWSRYNVDEELTKLEEVDEREERAEGRKKAFKVKSQLEKEVATTTEVSAEILAAQAAVAALKAKKGSKKRQEQEVSVLQNKADLLSLKSETIKHVLDARNTCQMHLKNQQYDTALPLYQDALKQLDKLTNVLPQLEELDLVDKTDHEHHHDHHHEESSCGHSHEEKAKKMDYVAALPDKEDLKGVLRMFRNDIYNGIGHAEFGRKKYALASEAHKNVLLDDPTNTIAWLGRGRAFARMGVPLLSFLHFNQVILYDAEHDEVQDEIDIAKAAIHDMFYQEQETLLNQQVERLKQDSIQDTLRAINDLRAEADILMVEGLFRSAARKNEAILSVLDETKLSKYNSSAAFQQVGCQLNRQSLKF